MPSHLIISSPEKSLEIAQSLAPFPLVPSPDCFISPSEGSLKIADVRAIKQFLTKKPYRYDHQVIYLPSAERLTLPAQNALLKTLEEPPNSAVIILTTNFPDRLLPTITSRCFIHQANHSRPEEIDPAAFLSIYESLIGKNVGQRLILAQAYAYPKTKAIATLQLALDYFRRQLHSTLRPSAARNTALAQKMLLYLEANCDPKLCLEHFFLHLV